MPHKKSKSNLWGVLICACLSALFLLLAAGAVSAAPCDIKPGSPSFIRHDLTDSYCELCGYGYVTIIIANPYEETDISDMTVVEDLAKLVAAGLR